MAKKIKIDIVPMRTEEAPGTVPGLWHLDITGVKGRHLVSQTPSFTFPLDAGNYTAVCWRESDKNELIGSKVTEDFEVTEVINAFLNTASGMLIEQIG